MSDGDTEEDSCMNKALIELQLFRTELKKKRKIQNMLERYFLQLVSQRENYLQYESTGDELEIFLAPTYFDENIYDEYKPIFTYHSGEDSRTIISENTNVEEEMIIKATETDRNQFFSVVN